MFELEEKNKDMEQIMEGALDIILEKDITIKEKFEEQNQLILELRELKNPPSISILPDILFKSILEIGENQEDGEYLLYILIKELTNNKDQYIEFLEDKLNTFCNKESICNCCGTELLYNYHEECVGEFQGSPAYQEFVDEGYCPYGCITY